MKLQFWNKYLYIRRQSRREAENDTFRTEHFNWNVFGLCIAIGRERYRTSAKEAAIKNGDISGYIEKRWKDQREYFSNKSAKMLSKYQSFQIWIILLSAVSAAVLALNFDELFGTIKTITIDSKEELVVMPNKWVNNRIVCALLTMLVVVLSSIDKLVQFREEWIKSRKASERLKREYCLYRLGAGAYEKLSKDDKKDDKGNDNSNDGKGGTDDDNDNDNNTEKEPIVTPPPTTPPFLNMYMSFFSDDTVDDSHEDTEDEKKKHQMEIDALKKAHEKRIGDLIAEYKKQIEDLRAEYQKVVETLTNKNDGYQKVIDDLNKEIEGFHSEIDNINTEHSKEIERRIGYFNLLVENLKKIEEGAECNQDFLDIVDEIKNFKEKVKNNCSDCFEKLFDDIKELVVFADTYKELLDNLCKEVSKNQEEAENNNEEGNKVVEERLKSLFDNYKKLIEQADTCKNLLCDLYNRITKQKEECETIVQENCKKMLKKIDDLVEASHLDKKLLGKISKEISAFQNGEGDYKLILNLNSNNVYYKTGLFVSRIRRINKEADGFLHELQEAIVNEIENFETMEDYFAINDRTAYFLQRVNEIAVQHKNGPGRYKCYRRLTEEISNYVRSAGEYSSFEVSELSSHEKKLVENLSRIAEADKFWLSRHFYYRDIQAEIRAFKLKAGDYADKKSDGDNSKNKLDYRDLVFVNNTEGIVAEDVEDFIARKIALANFEEQLDKIIEKKLGSLNGKKS